VTHQTFGTLAVPNRICATIPSEAQIYCRSLRFNWGDRGQVGRTFIERDLRPGVEANRIHNILNGRMCLRGTVLSLYLEIPWTMVVVCHHIDIGCGRCDIVNLETAQKPVSSRCG
jgi:hypothetical protein